MAYLKKNISMPRWVADKAGLGGVPNDSSRVVELMIKGLMAEKEEEILDGRAKTLNTSRKSFDENPAYLNGSCQTSYTSLERDFFNLGVSIMV